VWLAIFLLLLPAADAAGAPPVLVVSDGNAPPYREAVRALRAGGARVEHLALDDPGLRRRLRASPAKEVWIGLGPRSARRIAGFADRVRAAALLREKDVPAGLAAVTLDVPPRRQLRWIKTAFAPRRRVVVLRRPGSRSVDDSRLRKAAVDLGIELVLTDVKSAGEAAPALRAALRGRERQSLVWFVPDPTAINADTVSPLIRTALAARVPVVGFSGYFLRIGALAALQIDFGACARKALQIAAARKARSPAAPPEKVRFVVDGRLAERLGIRVTASKGDGIEVVR
jgi:hypothetical protein